MLQNSPSVVASGFALAVLLALAGCSGPSAQLTRCQEDKEQLLATIREQRDSGRALREQVASLETRLDEAEKELASRSGGTRLSSRAADVPSPVKSESLPWRAPSARTSSVSSAPTSQSNRLASSGASPVDVPVSFEGDSATLTADARRQLDEVARFLKSDAAREKRIMVAGYAAGRPSTTQPVPDGQPRFTSARHLAAARAQAVADYLDRHGIAQERLAVTGAGSERPPADPDRNRSARGGVRIFLLEPDAVVVGWEPSGRALR